VYQAESPDEGALVDAAGDLGYVTKNSYKNYSYKLYSYKKYSYKTISY
jgi:magnesium-transporting ATPase (P-type)